MKRLTRESKHGGKLKNANSSMEEWQQELSHDDIVRVLFDLGSAAECKEDPVAISSDVPVHDDLNISTSATATDSNNSTHIRKKAKRSSRSTVEEDQERDQLQQLLV